MNELVRMQYMEAMGVDVFVPRVLLPNANSSLLCALPEGVNFDVTDKVGPDAAISDSSLISELTVNSNELNRSVPNNELSKIIDVQPDGAQERHKPLASADSIVEALSTAGEDANEKIILRLSSWANNQFFVLDSRTENQAYPVALLLRNILSSVKLLNTGMPRMETIDWPSRMHVGKQGWREATDWLFPFIENKTANNSKHVFVMGNPAFCSLIGKQQDFSSNLYKQFFFESLGKKGLVLPSLEEILCRPELKHLTWRALCAYLGESDI